MKKAIVTLCVGEKFNLVSKFSHKTIENYSKKIEADFIVYRENISEIPHYDKFIIIYDLLKKYDRLLWLDTDLIIREDCPDLFNIVPEIKFGIFNEAFYTDRSPCIAELNFLYGERFTIDKYYNTGVMVVSKIHRNIFYPVKEIPSIQNSFGEQTYLNYRILKDTLVKIHDLPYKFNRMTMMDEYTGEDRLSSYIVHYAGCPTPSLLYELMEQDLRKWEEAKPDYKFKRTIFIQVGGGMGDQLCSEPVLRFIRKVYPIETTDIYMTTHWPRLFSHLSEQFIISDKVQFIKDRAIYRMETSPKENELIWKFISHPMIHPVDYASLSTLRRTLPDNEKQIFLEVFNSDMDEVLEFCQNPEDLVLVHPGRGWESKTFPIEWWQNIINNLIKEGIKIGIIGKYIGDDQGYLDVHCPEEAIDFRDMLSIGGLIALISKAKILITNDSAPLHIAGAFDNWIIAIPTCKHPDHILPYRKGNKLYKTKSLYKRLTCDAISSVPTEVEGVTVDIVPGNILDYLPDPKDIVNETIDILKEEYNYDNSRKN